MTNSFHPDDWHDRAEEWPLCLSQWKVTVCPFQSGFLMFAQTCLAPLSCPILSPSCPVFNNPSWPSGKGNLFPLTYTCPHTSLWAEANWTLCVPICQPIPRRMQTPSLEGICRDRDVLCGQKRALRRRPCVVSGDDKWPGRLSPVGNQLDVGMAWWASSNPALWP